MKKNWPIHPFLTAIFPILFLLAKNVAEMSLGEAIRPTIIVLVGTTILMVAFRLILRTWRKSAVVVSVFLVFFFLYGRLVFNTIGFSLDLGSIMLIRTHELSLIIMLMIVLAIFLLVRRVRSDLKKTTVIWNLVMIVMVVFQFATAFYAITTRSSHVRPAESIKEELVMPPNPPDIYFIVVDGYGRSDILKEIYDYDNSYFLSYLRSKGFMIADQANSNYCQTMLSLSGTLNLDYVSRLGDFDPKDWDRAPLRELVQENYLFTLLRKHGYHLTAFASGYSPTSITTADTYVHSVGALSEFENVVLSTTPIPYLLSGSKWQFDRHRGRLEQILDYLENMEREETPQLIFAHIGCPHPPFVYGPNGEHLARDWPFNFSDGTHYLEFGGTTEQYIKGYRDQITYFTLRLQETIDKILSRYPDQPPIIILQGDHGPGSGLYWQNVKKSNVRERMGILNACLIPCVDPRMFHSTITPINTMRLMLNKCFRGRYKRLPDYSIFTAWTRPYMFFDVTEQVAPRSVRSDSLGNQ